MACVDKSRPAELSSCRVTFSDHLGDQDERIRRTGWAEKRERGAIKTEAQTVAVSWKHVSELGGLDEESRSTHDPDTCLGDYSGAWSGEGQHSLYGVS